MHLFLPKFMLKEIDQSLLSKFLRCGPARDLCQYKVAWSQCCLPKLDGGLGLRDLVEWNNASITR